MLQSRTCSSQKRSPSKKPVDRAGKKLARPAKGLKRTRSRAGVLIVLMLLLALCPIAQLQAQNPSPLNANPSPVYMPLAKVGNSSNGLVTFSSPISQPITIKDIQVLGQLEQAGFLNSVGGVIPGGSPSVNPKTLLVGQLVPFNQILLNDPEAIVTGGNGEFAIADTADNLILLYDSRSGMAMVIANTGLLNPRVLSRDAMADILIGDTGNNRIMQLDWSFSPPPIGLPGSLHLIAGNGSVCSVPTDACGDGGLATSARFGTVLGLAHSRINSDLFIADTSNCRIRRIDGATQFIYAYAGNGTCGVGGDGGDPAQAALNNPEGLTMDVLGNLFIADTGNNLVRRVDAVTGKISTFAGNGSNVYDQDFIPATQTGLPGPLAVTVDYKGNVFITCGDSVVRKVDAITGFISTVAGTGQAGYNGDTLAALSSLSGPIGISTDAAGLMIADSGNNLVRRVDFITQDSKTEFAPAIDCIGAVLSGIGSFCNEGLTFTPAVPAVQRAQLVLTETHADSLGNPQTYTLSVPMNGIGSFTWGRVSATDVVIPETNAGQTSGYVRVLFANSGSVPMSFTGVSILNDATASFSEVDNCVQSQISNVGYCLADVNFAAPAIPGTYTAQLQFQSDALNGPQVVNLTGSSVVLQQASITWPGPLAAINYGTPLSAAQLNAVVAPANAPGVVTYSIPSGNVGLGSVIPAGLQTITATFTPTDPLQFTSSSIQQTLQVNQAPLTVTPNNLSIGVNAVVPATTSLTGTITGYVNPKDKLIVNYGYGSPAPSQGVVGVYPIIATEGSGAWSNYTVTLKTGTLTIGTPLPDLKVTALSAPATVTAGSSGVSVGDTTTNSGIAPAGSTSTAYYLSTSPTSNNRWMYLGNRTITSLGVNASSPGSINASFPANVTGTYYFYACANAYNSVTESSYTNNCQSAKITITSGVNLVLSGLTFTPSVLTAPGQAIQVFDTTQNSGTVQSPSSSSTAFYLSTTGTNKWWYLGNRTVPVLGAGASSTTDSTTAPSFTLPSFIHGNYFLLACANAYSSFPESSTLDNCQNVKITLP